MLYLNIHDINGRGREKLLEEVWWTDLPYLHQNSWSLACCQSTVQCWDFLCQQSKVRGKKKKALLV